MSDRYSKRYIDIESVMFSRNQIDYWDRLVFDKPESIGASSMVKDIRSLNIISCTERIMASEMYATYNQKGNLIDVRKVDTVFWPVPKGSKAEKIVDYICRLKEGPQKQLKGLNNKAAHNIQPNSLDALNAGKVLDKNEFSHIIRIKSAIYHVEPALIKAIIVTESGYNPYAISPKGAIGLMQLLPETAKRFGVFNLFDPEQNIDAGSKYLNYLSRLFNNNIRLVVAAYNAGENSVIKSGGRIPPYIETLNYVPKVISLYNLYKKSNKY